jgi:hypothetical protein
MNPNLLQKLDGYDYSDYNLKELSQHKDWNNIIKKLNPIICEMDPDMLSYCQDKISNIYDKYLNVEGQPNFEEAAKILKADMEKDNGPTWICIIGQDFSFNVKSQKEACLYGYLGHFGVLLYKC